MTANLSNAAMAHKPAKTTGTPIWGGTPGDV